MYYSHNEQSFDSMTWKILQLLTCFCISGSGGRDRGGGEGGGCGGGCACGRGKGCVDLRVNKISVVGHIGIDSIPTFLHNKNCQFRNSFGLCAQAVPKGRGRVTLRIIKSYIFRNIGHEVSWGKCKSD